MRNFKQFVNESTYTTDLAKVKKTIKSCKTEDQTEVADNTVNTFKKKWNDEMSDQDISELGRMIEDKFKEVQL
jgi:chromatin remodeling complex protein RSC6